MNCDVRVAVHVVGILNSLIANHCDKHDNCVMQAGKEIKSGFKKVERRQT